MDSIPQEKRCTKCGIIKPLTEYYELSNTTAKDGLTCRCKDCIRSIRKESYKARRDAELEYHRKRYQENKDHLQEVSRRWRKDNPDKHEQAKRKWENENYEQHRESSQVRGVRYRAKQAGVEGNYTAEQWAALCDQYGNVCLRCGKAEKLTVDHVVPLSKGGSNSIDNLQPLCRSCNTAKGQKTTDYRNGAGRAG